MTAVFVSDPWKVPMSPSVRIGLDGDAVWQRFLASRIAKEREFDFYQVDGAIDTGFITGFDDVCVQVSTSRDSDGRDETDPKAILIRAAAISKVVETGRRVSALEHEPRERIRGFSYALRQSAVRAVEAGKRREPETRPT